MVTGFSLSRALIYHIFLGTIPPVYIARFIASVSSALTLFLTYRWLKKLEVSLFWRVTSILLIGLNAYWLAYSTQSMTDTLSIFLLLGWLYFLEMYLQHSQTKHLVIAAFLALGNVMTRYEAWIFMAFSSIFLIIRSNRISEVIEKLKKNLIPFAVFVLPSIIFIGFWLTYEFLGKGDPRYTLAIFFPSTLGG